MIIAWGPSLASPQRLFSSWSTKWMSKVLCAHFLKEVAIFCLALFKHVYRHLVTPLCGHKYTTGIWQCMQQKYSWCSYTALMLCHFSKAFANLTFFCWAQPLLYPYFSFKLIEWNFDIVAWAMFRWCCYKVSTYSEHNHMTLIPSISLLITTIVVI